MPRRPGGAQSAGCASWDRSQPEAPGGELSRRGARIGDAGQPLSSEISNPVCRSCSVLEKATLPLPPRARQRQTRRSRRPCGCVEVPSARTGRACWFPLPGAACRAGGGTHGKRHRRYSRDARRQEVTWSHSTCEAGEQSRYAGSGVCGGKGITRGNCRRGLLAPDSAPDQAGHGCDRRRQRKDGFHLDRHTQGRSRMR